MVSIEELEKTDKVIQGEEVFYIEKWGRRNRVFLRECEECDGEFTPLVKDAMRGEGRFCSKSCSTTNRNQKKTGEMHNAYEGKSDFIREIKENSTCSKETCDESRPDCLCFHHISSEQKVEDVSRMAISGGYDLEDVRKEVEKCEILCQNCHRIEHSSKINEVETHEINMDEYYETEERFNQQTIYKKFNGSKKFILKDCDFCGQDFFAKLHSVKNGNGKYHSLSCAGRASHQHTESKQGFVRNIRENGRCSVEDCDECRNVCLDFHHVDSSEKVAEVSAMLDNGATLEELKEEVEKCELICASCHQVEHTA